MLTSLSKFVGNGWRRNRRTSDSLECDRQLYVKLMSPIIGPFIGTFFGCLIGTQYTHHISIRSIYNQKLIDHSADGGISAPANSFHIHGRMAMVLKAKTGWRSVGEPRGRRTERHL